MIRIRKAKSAEEHVDDMLVMCDKALRYDPLRAIKEFDAMPVGQKIDALYFHSVFGPRKDEFVFDIFSHTYQKRRESIDINPSSYGT